jgi:hypothetical protein
LLQIHISPSEPEDLALAKAEPEGDREERIQAVTSHGVEELAGLGLGQPGRVLSRYPDGPAEGHGLAPEQLPSHRLGERRSEDGFDVGAMRPLCPFAEALER